MNRFTFSFPLFLLKEQSDSFTPGLLQGACSPGDSVWVCWLIGMILLEMCVYVCVVGVGVLWLTVSTVLEGNQTFTCSLSSVGALKITCSDHTVVEVLPELGGILPPSFINALLQKKATGELHVKASSLMKDFGLQSLVDALLKLEAILEFVLIHLG